MNIPIAPLRPGSRLAPLAAAFFASLPLTASAGWIQTAAGPFEYNDAANWADLDGTPGSSPGDIDDIFPNTLTLAAAQTVTLNADRTLAGDWQFLYGGAFNLTLRGDGVANRTMTLGGNVTVDTQTDARTVTFGSTTALQNLNVALGATARIFTVGTGDTASFVNALSGGAGAGVTTLTKMGAGTLALVGTNTFTGNLDIQGGTVRVSSDAHLGDVANDIRIGDGATLRFDTAPTLMSGRTITVDAGATGMLNLQPGGVQTLFLNGTGQLAGGGTLVKAGNANGRMEIAGANVGFTGTFRIETDRNARTQLRHAQGLGTATIHFAGGVLPRMVPQRNGHVIYGNNVLVTTNAEFSPSRNDNSSGGTSSSTFGGLTLGANTFTIYGTSQIAGGGIHTLIFDGTHTLQGNGRVEVVNEVISGAPYDYRVELRGALGETGGARGLTFGASTTANAIGGTGALIFTGTTANTFSGPLTIQDGRALFGKSAGTAVVAGDAAAVTSDLVIGDGTGGAASARVQLTAAGQIADSAQVALHRTDGQFDLNGNDETIGSLTDLGSGAGGAVLLGAGTLTTGGNGNSTTFSGAITGAGALIKEGAGVFTLTGAQTYATLTANGGTTNLNSALGTGTSTLNANATVNIGVSQTLAALNIGSGALINFGAGAPFAGASVVPEPGSLGLLLAGALGLAGLRRRAREA